MENADHYIKQINEYAKMYQRRKKYQKAPIKQKSAKNFKKVPKMSNSENKNFCKNFL